jgi:hypothetical protein
VPVAEFPYAVVEPHLTSLAIPLQSRATDVPEVNV